MLELEVEAGTSRHMHIRRYTPDDWSRLCEIHDQARRQELEASNLQDAFLTLEQTAANEGLFAGEVLVADDNGMVVGFVAFKEGELTWMYVDPCRQRRGIGRQLLRAAITATIGPLVLDVLVGNEPALSLYLSEGFKISKRADGKLAGNEFFTASAYVLRHEGNT